MKRAPVYFRGYKHRQDTHPRYEALSKADWADVFCDLFFQVEGEGRTPEEALADAERRIEILKANGLR